MPLGILEILPFPKEEWRTYRLEQPVRPCRELKLRSSMAIYHLSASIVKRSAGRSVTAAAAYRAADKIEDIKTGIIHDYNRKQGVDYSEIISPLSPNSNLENEWLTNRAELWNKVELIEKRKDAQLAREVTIAIPCELPRAKQIALVREYVQTNYVAAGMIADINLHHLDGDNPHAHILLTMRNLQTTPEGVVEFGLKNTDWNSKELLLTQRKSWEDITNRYLNNHRLDIKIDCRSLKDQGSPYIPQIHIGVHAMAMHRKGLQTDRKDEFDRIEAVNNDIRTQLEEIYQQEYTEPEPELELEPEPKLTEEQEHKIAVDSNLAELITQVMPPNSRGTQTFGVYKIKPNDDGFRVTIDNSIVILRLRQENDIWVKSVRYPIKGKQYRHNYSNSDIDVKIDDFIKVIGEHKKGVDDLKIQVEAEKERVKAEIQIRRINNERTKAETKIQKVNNEKLKVQRSEEQRTAIEKQKIETKQRNIEKTETLRLSRMIAAEERRIKLDKQKIETEKRRIERYEEGRPEREKQRELNREKLQVERERILAENTVLEIDANKISERILELMEGAKSIVFDVEGTKLEFVDNQIGLMRICIDNRMYLFGMKDTYKYTDKRWTIEGNGYNITGFLDDIIDIVKRCQLVGIEKERFEHELEPVTTLKNQKILTSFEKPVPDKKPFGRRLIDDGNPLNHIHVISAMALVNEWETNMMETSIIVPSSIPSDLKPPETEIEIIIPILPVVKLDSINIDLQPTITSLTKEVIKQEIKPDKEKSIEKEPDVQKPKQAQHKKLRGFER